MPEISAKCAVITGCWRVESLENRRSFTVGMKFPGIITEVDLPRQRIALSMKSKPNFEKKRKPGGPPPQQGGGGMGNPFGGDW